MTSPPAALGGTPLFPQGPPDWPLPDEAVGAALQAAHADGSWGRYHGPHGERLRTALAAMHTVEHVTLCSSGTIAVELALRGLKIGAGDEVILAGYDFPGNFRAIEAVGARPVLVDLAPGSWTLDVDGLPAAASLAVRAVIVSHLHGSLAPMRAIMALAAERGWKVVEDACQSPGALVDGRVAGSWGDVGVLSFGGSKLLTAGRGGAILTPHADVEQRMTVYATRGNDAFPLSELQAAVLVPQLERLTERNALRRANVARLLERLPADLPLAPGDNAVGDEAAYYKLAWLYDATQGESSNARETFLTAVRAEGVAVDAGFRGFALRGGRRCRVAGDLHHSRTASERTVILHHPVLSQGPDDIDRLAEALVRGQQAANSIANSVRRSST